MFNTRLNSDLLISGKECRGGEFSGVSHKNCLQGQWLLTVDDINHCSPHGACTEAFVFPFIAELIKMKSSSNNEVSYYRIRPKDRITVSERATLFMYWVRFDLNGEATVVKRPLLFSISSDSRQFSTKNIKD